MERGCHQNDSLTDGHVHRIAREGKRVDAGPQVQPDRRCRDIYKLPHPPLPSAGVSTVVERGVQHNDRTLANGWCSRPVSRAARLGEHIDAAEIQCLRVVPSRASESMCGVRVAGAWSSPAMITHDDD